MKILLQMDEQEPKRFSCEREFFAFLGKQFYKYDLQLWREHYEDETRWFEVSLNEESSYEVSPRDWKMDFLFDMEVDEELPLKYARIARKIREAYQEHGGYHGKRFKAILPEKWWTIESPTEFNMLAYQMGGHLADETELALIWGQKIHDGTTLEELNSMPDDQHKWYRIVAGNEGGYKRVGGSTEAGDCEVPQTYVQEKNYGIGELSDEDRYCVPIVIVNI